MDFAVYRELLLEIMRFRSVSNISKTNHYFYGIKNFYKLDPVNFYDIIDTVRGPLTQDYFQKSDLQQILEYIVYREFFKQYSNLQSRLDNKYIKQCEKDVSLYKFTDLKPHFDHDQKVDVVALFISDYQEIINHNNNLYELLLELMLYVGRFFMCFRYNGGCYIHQLLEYDYMNNDSYNKFKHFFWFLKLLLTQAYAKKSINPTWRRGRLNWEFRVGNSCLL